jgi:hypothetical protein
LINVSPVAAWRHCPVNAAAVTYMQINNYYMLGEAFTKAEELADHVKEYVNTRVAIAKLDVAEKTSGVIANATAGVVVAVVLVLALIFGSIAGAYALGEWTGRMYWGFLIMAGFYLLAGVVVWNMRERLIRIPVMNAIIGQLFKEDNDGKN